MAGWGRAGDAAKSLRRLHLSATAGEAAKPGAGFTPRGASASTAGVARASWHERVGRHGHAEQSHRLKRMLDRHVCAEPMLRVDLRGARHASPRDGAALKVRCFAWPGNQATRVRDSPFGPTMNTRDSRWPTTDAPTPTSRRRRDDAAAERGYNFRTAVIALAVLVGCLWGVWYIAATAYRSQNCIYLFGHWISIHRYTNKMFCQ